jgi:NAD-dependent dihydropyrimidine dehydrogenase PreA subunit
MNKFFVSDKVYNDRLNICKGCDYYFKPTGNCKICLCFMSIKARISLMECPQKYWLKTKELEQPEGIPDELIQEVIVLWEDIKTGIAKNQAAKKRMITLFNTIYGSNYDTGTSCSTCLNDCFKGIKRIYEKYK